MKKTHRQNLDLQPESADICSNTSPLIAERLGNKNQNVTLNSDTHKQTIGNKRLRSGKQKTISEVQLKSTSSCKLLKNGIPIEVPSSGDNKLLLTPSKICEKKPELISSRNVIITDVKPSAGQSKSLNKNRSGCAKFETDRTKLPIWSKRSEICNSLKQNDVLLLKGDTGSGKSTQVPQLLCAQTWCKNRKVNIKINEKTCNTCNVGGVIAVTQPRRVAAITLAHRVAREMGSSLESSKHKRAGLVGYSVRFDKFLPSGMKIKFVTEGTLLQEMLQDPNLKQYSAIVVDEIHERSVDADLIVGFLKGIVHGDKSGRGGVPLKVIIMSATLDLKGIETFFTSSKANINIEPDSKDSGIISTQNETGKNRKPNFDDNQPNPAPFSNNLSNLDTDTVFKSKKCDSNKKLSFKNNQEDLSLHSGSSNNASTGNDFTGSRDQNSLDDKSGISVTFVEGRQYKVDIVYEVKPTADYMIRTLQVIMELHVKEPLPGDVLVFLTGHEEIETLQTELESYSQQLVKTLPRMKIIPLHGSLSAQAQQEGFKKLKEKFTRKIVLATNIAETSVTVPGVRYVVDCGKSKVKQYRPRLGLESLLIKPISKVSAIQRAGRAGREAEGKCFRLYTEEDFNKLDENEVPEILRCDIVEAVLKMKARGIDDVLAFPLMDRPNIIAMEKALIRLHLIGALDDNGHLTETGQKIARLPLPASYGRVLISMENKEKYLILSIIDIIASLTTDSEVFLQPKSEEERESMEEFRKDIFHREGDIITLLQTIQRYAAEATDRSEWCRKRLISIRAMKMAMQIRKQLRQICRAMNLLKETPLPDPQPMIPVSPEFARIILKSFLKAFATNTALLAPNGNYITTEGKHVITIHPSSVLYGKKLEAIMFLEHVFTAKSYARRVSAIEASWIIEALTT
ncbi:putative ATP-dependent RNA helicase prh1 [Erysiphe neolycopersici]|uniref:RNA helicase n=1 Tax=Erysiphe neolycopersici TaxID=212602 RepID=A0A420HHZ4_9PEZI|nr:putative ATP-dependent RNA helicase prh1 [Erysiphe neolycopersici]